SRCRWAADVGPADRPPRRGGRAALSGGAARTSPAVGRAVPAADGGYLALDDVVGGRLARLVLEAVFAIFLLADLGAHALGGLARVLLGLAGLLGVDLPRGSILVGDLRGVGLVVGAHLLIGQIDRVVVAQCPIVSFRELLF